MSVVMLPGSTGANLTIKHYARTIEKALYNRMQALPRFKERAEKLLNGLYVRRMGRATSQTLNSTHPGTGITYSDLSPVLFQLEPVWLLAAAAWPDSSPRRMGGEIEPETKDNLNECIQSAIDFTVLGEFTAFSSTPYGGPASDIDTAILRNALTTLETNSRRRAKAGDDLHLLLPTTQVGPSLAIPEITHAEQRGDGKGPLVTGKVAKGMGFMFDYTTLLTLDANGYNGAAFHGECIQYGWNQRAKPEKQRLEKQDRFFVDCEVGYETIYQELAVPIRTR